MIALGMSYGVTSGDVLLGKTLTTGDWLATLVYTSLFTDARAAADEVPAGETSRGGYWGDAFSERSLGSLLWTLRREKLTPPVLLRVRDICLQALVWLLDAGHITAVDVQTSVLAADRLGIAVICTRAPGAVETYRYETQQVITDAI